ncbi:hypothetical protein AHiyo4_39160 [Arthrobacter sp. Hiyo4]|nr:hypothetical protein AHiyo4_39160 [Arthrobacter sp. Hiyo4]
MGCSAARIPTAVYSCRAISAKRRIRSALPTAARPIGSGHCEKWAAVNDTPEFSMNAWRGSVEMVTGIPCGACAASSCRALLQRAASRALPSAWTLKWFMNLPRITVLVGDLLMLPGVSSRVPSGPVSMTVWNISPAFSSRLRRVTRSAARSCGLRSGFSKGSMIPFPLRSRKAIPSATDVPGRA